MRNCCRKLLLIIQIVLIPALLLSGCADLKISKALVQHAVGGIYDPTDQIAVEQLNAILDAVVAQDAAAIKAQFALNAVAAQPELDDQIETLLGYYSEDNGVIKDTSRRSGSSANGAGTKSSYYIIRGRIEDNQIYLFAMRAITEDETDPDNIGVWALFLLRVDYPIDRAYYVKDEDNMVGIYVDLPPKHMQY